MKALKEGFLNDSMEVGIEVNGGEKSHCTYCTRSKCISKGPNIASVFKTNTYGTMSYGRAPTERNEVRISVAWTFEMNQNLKEHPWKAQHQ